MTQTRVSTRVLVAASAFFAVAAALVTALLMNIFERKVEQATPFVRLVEVTEDDTDPETWAPNWPQQYDGYRRTAIATRTRFGGHGGSEALPEQKIERDPWLKRMFLGYAFSIDYRDRRGHAYMLEDQENTERLSKPQSGSCLHCHASVMPLYRKLGDGDAVAGFEKTYQYSYQELHAMLEETGSAHPVSCVDCHDPQTLALRVTRPGFLQGIQALAEGEAEVPHLPSIQEWRAGDRRTPYDPNEMATRLEMRSYVCGQCHVEYYCSSGMKLTFPWGEGSQRRPDRGVLGRDHLRRRQPLPGLPPRRDRGSDPEGPAPGVRAVEPGDPRAERCLLRGLPHALHATGRHQGLRPLGAQPAPPQEPGLPELPPLLGGGAPGPGGRDPGSQPRAAAAGGPGDRRPDRRHRRGPGGRGQRRPAGRGPWSSSGAPSGASTSSPPRTPWGSTRPRRPPGCWARPPTTRARGRSRRSAGRSPEPRPTRARVAGAPANPRAPQNHLESPCEGMGESPREAGDAYTPRARLAGYVCLGSGSSAPPAARLRRLQPDRGGSPGASVDGPECRRRVPSRERLRRPPHRGPRRHRHRTRGPGLRPSEPGLRPPGPRRTRTW